MLPSPAVGAAELGTNEDDNMLLLEQRLTHLLTAESPLNDSDYDVPVINERISTLDLIPARRHRQEISPSPVYSSTKCASSAKQSTSNADPVRSYFSSSDSKPQRLAKTASKLPVTVNKPSLQKETGTLKQTRPQKTTTAAEVKLRKKVKSIRNEQQKSEVLQDELKQSYSQLLQELESERERRWKAEQITLRLVEEFKSSQSKQREEHEVQQFTLAANLRLKRVIENDREKVKELEEEKKKSSEERLALESDLKDVKARLDSHKARENELESEMKNLKQQHTKIIDNSNSELESLKNQLQTERAQHMTLQHCVETSHNEVRQLQETLAAREAEYQKKQLNFEDLERVLRERAESSHLSVLEQLKTRLREAQVSYKQLEDEFRLALQSEARRYKELEDNSSAAVTERNALREKLAQLSSSEKHAQSLVSELTELVKEQKGRLIELERARAHSTREHRVRDSKLHDQLEEARRRLVSSQLLEKEKTRLESELRAQRSVVEGLRAERGLWSEELAQQGAALSQDRGRLEAKIEQLTSELAALKTQLQLETDSVRVKTKVIEDQVETIKKLKEGLLERDSVLKSTREESLKIQKDLEARLVEEAGAFTELQTKLDHSHRRKQELKEELATLALELKQSKEQYKQMTQVWRNKAQSISQVERQVSEMKKQWEEKEAKLTVERDEAVEKATQSASRLKQVDDAFRSQIEAATEQHEKHIKELQLELKEVKQQSQKQVAGVEAEMRSLLLEAEQQKQAQQQKLRNATDLLSQLTSGL